MRSLPLPAGDQNTGADRGCGPRRRDPKKRLVAGVSSGVYAVLRGRIFDQPTRCARLQQGLDELRAPRSCSVRLLSECALVMRSSAYRPAFPGDPETGILTEDEEAERRFEDFANDEPCPVLDPATGICDVVCFATDHLPCLSDRRCDPKAGWECASCAFTAPSDEQIAACEMER